MTMTNVNMLEDLVDYLIRHGYSSDIANKIHGVCYYKGIAGIEKYAAKIVEDVKNWKKEIGED